MAAVRLALERRGCEVTPALGETIDQTVVRFVRARNLNVDKAAEMLARDQEWRRVHQVDALRSQTAESVLGCDLAHLQAVLPHKCVGCDRSGRPVIYKHFGAQCMLSALLPHTSVDRLLRYNTWINEQYVAALAAAGADKWTLVRQHAACTLHHRPHMHVQLVDTLLILALRSPCIHAPPPTTPRPAFIHYSQVIDASGWHPGLFDGTAYAVLKDMASTDSDHYPERLQSLTIINSPALLAFAWKVHRLHQTHPAPCSLLCALAVLRGPGVHCCVHHRERPTAFRSLYIHHLTGVVRSSGDPHVARSRHTTKGGLHLQGQRQCGA